MRVSVWSALAVAFFFCSTSQQLTAAPLEYVIAGTGSGVFAQHRFTDLEYTIQLDGDSRNYRPLGGGYVLDALDSATIALEGIGSFTIDLPTRLGISKINDVFFSRSGDQSLDLLDFELAAPTDLLTTFGPVTSTKVYALAQFEAVPTSGGSLTLSSSSDVTFTSVFTVAPVPLPSTLPLLGCGLLALGVGTRLRRRVGTR